MTRAGGVERAEGVQRYQTVLLSQEEQRESSS